MSFGKIRVSRFLVIALIAAFAFVWGVNQGFNKTLTNVKAKNEALQSSTYTLGQGIHFVQSLSSSSDPRSVNTVPQHGIILDGQTNYIKYNQISLPLSQPLTIETWVYPLYNLGSNAYQSALSTPLLAPNENCSGGTFDINIIQDPNPSRFDILAMIISGNTAVGLNYLGANSYGTWHHIAVTLANNTATLFVDGRQASQGLLPYGICDSGQGIFSGAKKGVNEMDPQSFFKGRLSETRISNTVRYTADFTPQTEFTLDNNTLALWRLNGNASDSSSHGNNGKTTGTIKYFYPNVNPGN